MGNYREFLEIIGDLQKNEIVNQMKKYRQHCDVNTYDHCKNVAFICYVICKKLKLDYQSAARAGMLHDLFLYDWREKRPCDAFKNKHAFSHPRIALKNAKEITTINEIEEDIILNHMWPLTIKLPKYKESYVITVADKYSTILETADYCKRKFLNSKLVNKLKTRNYGI